MLTSLKWLGTILQLVGSATVALHLPWSGWGFPVMLAGAIVWGGIAIAARDWALAALQIAFSILNIIGIWRHLMNGFCRNTRHGSVVLVN